MIAAEKADLNRDMKKAVTKERLEKLCGLKREIARTRR